MNFNKEKFENPFCPKSKISSFENSCTYVTMEDFSKFKRNCIFLFQGDDMPQVDVLPATGFYLFVFIYKILFILYSKYVL